jgi:hypothetical protein
MPESETDKGIKWRTWRDHFSARSDYSSLKGEKSRKPVYHFELLTPMHEIMFVLNSEMLLWPELTNTELRSYYITTSFNETAAFFG